MKKHDIGNPIPFYVKVLKIGNSIRMTIPKQVVEYLKLKQGDTLKIMVKDHVMTVVKTEPLE